MLSDKTILFIRKIAAPLSVALSFTLFCPPVLHSAGEQSYAREIQRYVAEDKVYLLENLRQKVALPSEKLLLEALLSEDGPQAVSLYQKQLALYPDPALDQISRSRIAAYSLAMEGAAPVQPLANKQDTTKHLPTAHIKKSEKKVILPEKSKPSQPRVKVTKQDTTTTGQPSFTVRFGSFKNRDNAKALAKKISLYAPAETIKQGELYRVQLKNNYASKQEAEAAAKKLPFAGFVIPAI
jgi:septal ring-binding cell division protein DamX